MDRIKIFQKELNTITDPDIKQFAENLINNAPEYFFHVPASSTGKYHPTYALGEGGLVRHTKAVVRFYNHIMSLEQNKYYEIYEVDCGIVACLAHDMMKSGPEDYYDRQTADGKKVFTVFNHPLIAAEFVTKIDSNIRPEYVELISDLISSHMGEWNTSKQSSVVLPKPTSNLQQIVHLADYLASRKDIEIIFEDDEKMIEIPDVDTAVCPFKKYKGMLYKDIVEQDPDYLTWLYNNIDLKEPTKSIVRYFTKSKM